MTHELIFFDADAGIYIPLIMKQIDENGGINLKGAAIGDGVFMSICMTPILFVYLTWMYQDAGATMWACVALRTRLIASLPTSTLATPCTLRFVCIARNINVYGN